MTRAKTEQVRKTKKAGPMKVRSARLTSVTNLIAIGASAVFYLLGWEIAGLSMLIVALLAFCFLIGTGVYRIAGGQPLDDMEEAQMRKSYARSYWVVATGLVLAVLGLQIFDNLAAILQNDDGQTFLFWSLTSIVMVLPAAFLAWNMPVEEIGED